MTEIPYIPSKERLKSTLSLPYVCARLGINMFQDNTALCPFHQDSTPSFHLFEGDDGIERWSCMPCGQRGGDIFDLIQKKLGYTFSEAIVWAAGIFNEMPPGYERPRILPRATGTPDDWSAEVQGARHRAATKEQQGLMAAILGLAPVSDIDACYRWDTYLRETWGWGIDDRGIYQPHWSPDGTLTGCKIRRADGRKESLTGSRYEHLYGSWLGRRYNDVLITEGESDAVWAGYQCALERLPIDVFAMPSGAQQEIDARWMTFLAGARTVYLALDPDDGIDNGTVKGVEGTRNWITALWGPGGFKDVRVCALPLGKDLRDARPNMRRLLTAARQPIIPPDGISESPAGYIRMTKDGALRAATNWVAHPRARLTGEGDEGFDVVIEHRGVKVPGIMRLSDLGSVRDLRRWANKQGMVFTGSDPDMQKIAELINERGGIVPEVFQSNQVGLRAAPDEYAFAGVGAVFPTGYLGQIPWRYVPTAKGPADVTGRVLLPTEGQMDWGWLESYLALSGPEVMQPLLAWIVAAARRRECGDFPVMFVGGSSGVGKSTISRLTLRLAGSGIETGLGSVTPYILMRTLAASTSLPVFVDEWTRLSRADTREAFQGNLPVLYSGGLAERGQADLTTQSYTLSAPTLVAGEDTFALDRERDRIVGVYPSREKQNVEALSHIVQAPLERFGMLLHSWLASNPEHLPNIGTPCSTRPEYNRQILLSGWATLHQLLDYAREHGDEPPTLPLEPDLSVFEREDRDGGENVYEAALREGLPIRDQNGVPVVWTDPHSRGTWIRARALLGELRRRQWDLELPGGERAMLDYYEERYSLSRRHRVQPPMSMTAVWATLIEGLLLEEGDVEREPADVLAATWATKEEA